MAGVSEVHGKALIASAMKRDRKGGKPLKQMSQNWLTRDDTRRREFIVDDALDYSQNQTLSQPLSSSH